MMKVKSPEFSSRSEASQWAVENNVSKWYVSGLFRSSGFTYVAQGWA